MTVINYMAFAIELWLHIYMSSLYDNNLKIWANKDIHIIQINVYFSEQTFSLYHSAPYVTIGPIG